MAVTFASNLRGRTLRIFRTISTFVYDFPRAFDLYTILEIHPYISLTFSSFAIVMFSYSLLSMARRDSLTWDVPSWVTSNVCHTSYAVGQCEARLNSTWSNEQIIEFIALALVFCNLFSRSVHRSFGLFISWLFTIIVGALYPVSTIPKRQWFSEKFPHYFSSKHIHRWTLVV